MCIYIYIESMYICIYMYIQVRNPDDYPVGCTLCGNDVSVTVISKQAEHLQVDRLLTRKEAASLFRTFVSAEPEIWCGHFLDQWNSFWNRPQVEEDSIHEVIQAMPSFPPVQTKPLSLEDWRSALKSAKKRTMRGADGWSVQELAWLSDPFTLLLLCIFRAAEVLRKWPEQLSTWVLVLLRKTNDACPGWSLIRPITVAGVCYRIWSRVRTAQLMQHARSISKPLVSPCLSTRAIWTFLGDLISQKVSAKQPLAGLVLDITKCFNILDRGLLRALMLRFGFPETIVDAWLAMLSQLSRTVLVEGAVYGCSSAVTGIPEGDPLSVVGMFVFAKAFDHFVQHRAAHVLCLTYADNWELVARSALELIRAIPVVERFLDLCHLLVSPAKCWFWAICPTGRRKLRSSSLLQQRVPVKLQARELGADISYCNKKAARERNGRVTSGLSRMSKLHGLPGSVYRKTRLLLSGIFPHALHAAETSSAPKSVFQRLRSGAANAVECRPKGSSPWLACLLATYRCIDPEFVLIINRIQLFRQVVKELPALSQFFFDGLIASSLRPGPTRLLVTVLSSLGWSHVGDGTFMDDAGRVFHVCLTPLRHVQTLLLSSWTGKVASQVRHRKYLSELENICVPLTQMTRHLLSFEKALVRQQQIGAFFSGEFTKHIDQKAAVCRFCGQLDSRLHRLRWCQRTDAWRSVFPSLFRQWDSLPEFITAFGLFPEPEGWREWQSVLDSRTLPGITRSFSCDLAVFYTDGACLFPRHPVIRVASGAVLRANVDGTFQVCWHGALPGSCQSIFRAELLAVACAVGMANKPVVFTDSQSVCRTANRILRQLQAGNPPGLPQDNKDLWAFFLSNLRGCDLDSVHISWIKGHVNYRTAVGLDKIHAWFNHWADLAAKQALAGHDTPLFRHMVEDYKRMLSLAQDLYSFQAGVALIFANDGDAPEVNQQVRIGRVHPVGLLSSLWFEHDIHPVVCHQGFARSLINWMREMRWTSTVSVDGLGSLQDTSWLELFWGYIHDTSALPAFWYYHEWVWVQDDLTLEFAIPSFATLFRTWKRTFDSILRSGVAVPWTLRMARVRSVRALGSRFDCPGFNGRVLFESQVLQNLSAQFAYAPRLSSLRVPAFN